MRIEAKTFGDECFGAMKQKLNHLAETPRELYGERRDKPFTQTRQYQL